VAVIQSALAEIKPGEIMPYDKAAAVLSLTTKDPVFYRRAASARANLRRQGISIIAVHGQGFLRETAAQTLARCNGRERLGIQRHSRKVGESLSGIDATALDKDQRDSYFAQRTINNIIHNACSVPTRQKLLGAVAASQCVLPMAQAVAVLGSNAANGTDSTAH
jgi:hypothetical protein